MITISRSITAAEPKYADEVAHGFLETGGNLASPTYAANYFHGYHSMPTMTPHFMRGPWAIWRVSNRC